MKLIREGDLAYGSSKASCSQCEKPAQRGVTAFWGQIGFMYLCSPCLDAHQKAVASSDAYSSADTST